MTQDRTRMAHVGMSRRSFQGAFGRASDGLDPDDVYNYCLELWARIEQLEEQAGRVSAPMVLEIALREADDARVQAVRSAERAYDQIIQEAERRRSAATRHAEQLMERAGAMLAEGERQADDLCALAFREADRIRREAERSSAGPGHAGGPVRPDQNTGTALPTWLDR